jgi:hypothetical protein
LQLWAVATVPHKAYLVDLYVEIKKITILVKLINIGVDIPRPRH